MLKRMKSDLTVPAFEELLTYSVGPNPERVKQVAEKYKKEENWHMYWYIEKEELVGLIGMIQSAPREATILHIAVMPEYRTQGIGGRMIEEVCLTSTFQKISAETDKYAVDFYRKQGFTITSLGEKYPGVERFICELRLP